MLLCSTSDYKPAEMCSEPLLVIAFRVNHRHAHTAFCLLQSWLPDRKTVRQGQVQSASISSLPGQRLSH